MKEIIYRTPALRVLNKMPANTARRIRGKIEDYARDPASQSNNVKKLIGRPGIRLRVGDWRVIMKDGEVLEILRIGPRGSVYE